MVRAETAMAMAAKMARGRVARAIVGAMKMATKRATTWLMSINMVMG
jgi:hypothetical protein